MNSRSKRKRAFKNDFLSAPKTRKNPDKNLRRVEFQKILAKNRWKRRMFTVNLEMRSEGKIGRLMVTLE